MTYKTESGKTFTKAFDAVQYAFKYGCKVGIYRKEKFVRWLV